MNNFKENMNKRENKDCEKFWKEYFDFARDKLKFYYSEVKDLGLDPIFILPENMADGSMKITESLDRLEGVLTALSIFDKQLSRKKDLENELTQKEEEMSQLRNEIDEKKQQILKGNKGYEKLKRDVETKEQEVKNKLLDNLKLVRNKFFDIEDYLLRVKNSELKMEEFDVKLRDAINNMADIFEKNGLWPEGENKPGQYSTSTAEKGDLSSLEDSEKIETNEKSDINKDTLFKTEDK